ncbi:MAG: hypothetical protein WAN41_11900, partial [Candidatus Sulfotelmatobacter sp.]
NLPHSLSLPATDGKSPAYPMHRWGFAESLDALWRSLTPAWFSGSLSLRDELGLASDLGSRPQVVVR